MDHYHNGNPIPQVQEPKEWCALTSGARYFYYDDPANNKKYGKLYNWYAVNDPRGLAPRGWHVPTDAEWGTLVDYLGVNDVAGSNMKKTGTNHWSPPNNGATNESGFSALPDGFRDDGGSYDGVGRYTAFWSFTEHNSYYAWFRDFYFDSSDVSRDDYNKRFGLSVRCLMD